MTYYGLTEKGYDYVDEGMPSLDPSGSRAAINKMDVLGALADLEEASGGTKAFTCQDIHREVIKDIPLLADVETAVHKLIALGFVEVVEPNDERYVW